MADTVTAVWSLKPSEIEDKKDLAKEANRRIGGSLRWAAKDCRKLAEQVQDWMAGEAWTRLTPDWDEFCEKYVGHSAEHIERMLLGVEVLGDRPISMTDAVSKGEAIAMRQQEARRLAAEGLTQQQIADKLGVSQKTVSNDLVKNRGMPQKSTKPKPKRKRVVYQIQPSTSPQTAAAKIRDKFGDAFADELKRLL